jgi:hypothetical protein
MTYFSYNFSKWFFCKTKTNQDRSKKKIYSRAADGLSKDLDVVKFVKSQRQLSLIKNIVLSEYQ